jgi:hypothetical protein
MKEQKGKLSGNDKLKRFFHWILRRTFQDLRRQDSQMVEYLSDMLTRFARTERLYKLRDSKGKVLTGAVEMLLESERFSSDIQKERAFFQYLGDYILFMTGVFREFVESRGFMNFYIEEGIRAYKRVWEVEQCMFRPTTRLFERLWRSFEFNAGALHYMRKTFFREPRGDDPFTDWRKNILILAR